MRTSSLGIAIVFTLMVSTPASASPRCGLPARLMAQRLPTSVPPKVLRAGGVKQVRDGFPGPHQVKTSANFAVRWRDAVVTDERAQATLDALEQGYAMFTGAFAHREPIGAEAYLINAYLSNGPDDVPAIDFAGGAAWVDDEGYPYIILSKALLADDANLRVTAVHELYHDIQISTGAFAQQPWYWEASAEWATQEVLPGNSAAYMFMGAYALAEELPIFLWSDPFGADPVIAVHQYGAAAFPRYVTTTRNDRSLVPETWSTGGADDDPLRALLELVATSPDQVADLFIEFAAHQVLHDVAHADAIKPWVELYAKAYPGRDRIDGRVIAVGAPDWTSPERLPHAFGFDIIELERPADGNLRVELRADDLGSLGTAAVWRAMLIRKAGAQIEYTPAPIKADGIAVTLEPTEDKAWLVVASIADTRNVDEAFAFQYRINAALPPEPLPPTDTGGCSAAGSRSWLLVVLVALVASRLRPRFRMRAR